jgi:hypothetical protein
MTGDDLLMTVADQANQIRLMRNELMNLSQANQILTRDKKALEQQLQKFDHADVQAQDPNKAYAT